MVDPGGFVVPFLAAQALVRMRWEAMRYGGVSKYWGHPAGTSGFFHWKKLQ